MILTSGNSLTWYPQRKCQVYVCLVQGRENIIEILYVHEVDMFLWKMLAHHALLMIDGHSAF